MCIYIYADTPQLQSSQALLPGHRVQLANDPWDVHQRVYLRKSGSQSVCLSVSLSLSVPVYVSVTVVCVRV